ncbi:MAG: sigma-54-dependent Fis family transcriptional regulator [Deltaproteobacteria bacterium]|nr:sigma-54-dependent Fis family transcriptional regulator [Deltaproteobacteria bacterium]
MARPTEEAGARGSDATASAAARVVVVDDEPTLRRTIARTLAQRGFEVTQCEDGQSALEHVRANDPDVMLIDLMMPGVSGMDVLREAKALRPDVECVIMTAYSRVEDAVAAVRAGAYDFLTKPFPSFDAVAITVAKAAERRRLIAKTRSLEEQLDRGSPGGLGAEIIGQSAAMRRIFRLVEGVASASSTVLILGESGTGKELVARAIHRRSARATRQFVAVNCSSIPDTLIESELFGHVKGAFTSANTSRAGLFEIADKGTLFLDEVGDLSLAAQVKLLRALQEGEIKRVGANDVRTVDVRVIAATNVDLAQKIDAGRFREDLFYRLNVIAIELPPLRDRRDDIPLLAQHFLRKFARKSGKEVRRLGAESLAALTAYGWPGNVRQLENAIERAVVLARGDDLMPDDLPVDVVGTGRANGAAGAVVGVGDAIDVVARVLGDVPYAEAKRRIIRDFDRAYAQHLLERSNGNVSEAARLAGLDRSNFRRVLRKHGSS